MGPMSTAALRAQMTEYRMRTEYRRVLRGVWLRADVEPTFDVMGRAAAIAFPDGTLCGWSAAHLWGNTALPRDRRPEIAVPVDGRRHDGVHVRRMQLGPEHITHVDGQRCTTLTRTAVDLARFSARDDAVAALDVMTRSRPDLPALMRTELRTWENHWGVDKAHRATRLIDPAAESPWETRLRLGVVDAELDGWICQWEVFGGRYRLDMAWPRWKVAAEYDGAHHRDGGAAGLPTSPPDALKCVETATSTWPNSHENYTRPGRALASCFFLSSRAMSMSWSSWPPTSLRAPASRRMSATLTPYLSAWPSACLRNEL